MPASMTSSKARTPFTAALNGVKARVKRFWRSSTATRQPSSKSMKQPCKAFEAADEEKWTIERSIQASLQQHPPPLLPFSRRFGGNARSSLRIKISPRRLFPHLRRTLRLQLCKSDEFKIRSRKNYSSKQLHLSHYLKY